MKTEKEKGSRKQQPKSRWKKCKGGFGVSQSVLRIDEITITGMFFIIKLTE